MKTVIINGTEYYRKEEVDAVMPKKEEGRWKPKEGDDVFYVNSLGFIMAKKCNWEGGHQEYLMAQGNLFPTLEEAQAHANYLKALGNVRVAIWEGRSHIEDNIHVLLFEDEWIVEEYPYSTNLLPAVHTTEFGEQILTECADDLEIIREYLMK